MTIEWANDIVPAVKERLQDRRNRGIPKASLRGIFYSLISLELIPNTHNAYKTLSRTLVNARRKDSIPNDWIVDETRKIVDIEDRYITPASKVEDYIYTLFDWLPEHFKDELLPRWHNQPNYVEVWIEKNAMRGVFISIIDAENRQVRIGVCVLEEQEAVEEPEPAEEAEEQPSEEEQQPSEEEGSEDNSNNN